VERKKTVNFGQGPVQVTEVGFRAGGEYWNEYLADDGTVIRVKVVVTDIMRLDGQYDAEGNPGYVVKSTTVTSVSATDELRRPD